MGRTIAEVSRDRIARGLVGRLRELNALERLVAEKKLTDQATLARYYDAWDHAADRTPHGQPIELRPDDFAK